MLQIPCSAHLTPNCLRTTCLMAILVSCLTTRASAADSVDRQVKEILRIGVEGQQSPSSKLPALQAKFAEIGDADSIDPQVRYAFGLVHGTLGKTKEAANLLARSTQELTGDVRSHARCAAAWTLIVEKKYAPAIEQLAELGKEIHESSKVDAKYGEKLLEPAAQMFAFLAARVDATQGSLPGVPEAKLNFEAFLNDQQAKVFSEAFADTQDHLANLQERLEEARAKDREESAEKKERIKELADSSKSELDRDRSELEAAAAQERAKLTKAQADLDRQLLTDRNLIVQLQTTLEAALATHARLQRSHDSLFVTQRDSQGNEAQVCTNPGLANQLNRQVRETERAIVNMRGELEVLRRRGDAREQQRGLLANQGVAVAKAITQKDATLKRKAKTVQKQQAIANKDEDHSQSTTTLGISQKINSLRTFCTFPFEAAGRHLVAAVSRPAAGQK